MSSFSPSKYLYSPLKPAEEKKATSPTLFSQVSSRLPAKWLFLLLLVLCVTGLAGLEVGRCLANTERTKSPISLGRKSIVFQSDRAYIQRPSPESDQAWKALYPADHGFFDYPNDKPLRSTFAGFHQLHCVDTLRRGFYELHDSREALRILANSSDNSVTVHEEEGETITLDHCLHCIEFLRQSIMCHADTTVEAKDEKFKGVVGFGIAHECMDWGQMVRWVDERNQVE